MTQPEQVEHREFVAEWDLADRMRKALRIAGLKPGDLAAHLGVESHTVSRWINGRNQPSRATVLQWALRTGVPAEWLLTGNSSVTAGYQRPATVHVLPVGRRPR
jgi:transcriptional regulator with XRE-family HTH domain